MLVCAAVGVILLAGNIRGDAQTGHAVGPESVTNEYCPVLTDKKVDPEVFSDYDGKRVYFCCQACKAEFGENPEKYLGRLPQFGSMEGHGEHGGVSAAQFVKPMGVTTLVMLFATASAGFLRRRKPAVLLRWHKRLAVATLACAATHAFLVLVFH
ncbi:MAG: YHS domain-containing protein [Planctomycetes bacterium]|nr:YHS domain-containing protein [Planctomycetota bacterium]